MIRGTLQQPLVVLFYEPRLGAVEWAMFEDCQRSLSILPLRGQAAYWQRLAAMIRWLPCIMATLECWQSLQTLVWKLNEFEKCWLESRLESLDLRFPQAPLNNLEQGVEFWFLHNQACILNAFIEGYEATVGLYFSCFGTRCVGKLCSSHLSRVEYTVGCGSQV